MSDCHSVLLKLFVLLCGLLCIVSTLAIPVESPSASPPLGALVPKIEQEDFQLIPEGNGYKLTVYVPYGNSRIEDVTLIDNKELSVKGELYLYFGTYVFKAEYVADGDGYRIKYTYSPLTFGASPNLLKSAAG